MTDALDPVALTQKLVRRRSVTPEDDGALHVLQEVLEGLGFACERWVFDAEGTAAIDNLYARWTPPGGTNGPEFCFAGHTDVVPAGDESAWRSPPFAAEIVDGAIYGRGTADMKGDIAAFVTAAARYLGARPDHKGAISLLITGDEEGPAVNGTVKMLERLAERGDIPTHCLVGEPTSRERLGDQIKIGRRGSLTTRLTVKGRAGHVAYAGSGNNPLHRLGPLLTRLTGLTLDQGTDHFEPSGLQITSVETGNTADNVVPGAARAVFNIRFNDAHTHDSLEAQIKDLCAETLKDAPGYELTFERGGVSFVTKPGAFTDLLSQTIEAETGAAPVLSTGGGTSDARFIQAYCPVAEFGLVGRTIHQVDEHVPLADLTQLTTVYERLLEGYFSREWT